jgi:hypothetical protein
MKDAEGGAVALDPRHLSMVVLELRRRGHRHPGSALPPDGCARASPKGAPSTRIQFRIPLPTSPVVEELETDVQESAIDFARRR